MTIDTSLLVRSLVTNAQFNELICDYDENTQTTVDALNELNQRVSALESMIGSLIEGKE